MKTPLFCLLTFLLLSCIARCEDDAIVFDSRPSFPFRDVTPDQFRQKNPTRHIVEVTFRISSSLSVHENDVESLVYSVAFPTNVDIADFLPKTELGSEVAGPMDAKGDRTTTGSIRVAVEGEASARYLNIASVGVAGIADKTSTDSTSSGVHVSLLPPKQVVLSAGTSMNGSALQFKLRPYNQMTLEGEHEFVALLSVPADWSGCCAMLKCIGRLKFDHSEYVRDTKVALYPDGDTKVRTELEAEATQYQAKQIPPALRRESLVGVWEGNWRHAKFGAGRMNCSFSSSGDFSGIFLTNDGATIGYFGGNVQDGNLSFTQTNLKEQYTGQGIVGLDKEGHLQGSLEYKVRGGNSTGALQIALWRK